MIIVDLNMMRATQALKERRHGAGVESPTGRAASRHGLNSRLLSRLLPRARAGIVPAMDAPVSAV